MLIQLIEGVYRLLWGDLLTLHLGNVTLSLSFMVILLFTAGIYFTLRTRLLPMRLFRDMLAAVCEKNDKGSGLSSFQTLVVSTATRVGMGNLVGVVAAVSAGGAGAVFWMWVISFFGMATIYAEATLAQETRIVEKDGNVKGGPVYYITTAFKGGFGKFLAGFFSVAIIFALGFTGNMVQANSISVAFNTAFGAPMIVVGIICAIIAAFIFLGGVGRIASVTEKVVPIMALFYMAGCIVILCINHAAIIPAFKSIFVAAFDPQAILGGAAGITVRQAMRYGVARGLFSNEAGMGSTPHAHALAKVKRPQDQGEIAIVSVFIDTFIVLTLTAMVILTSGMLNPGAPDGLQGTELAQAAFKASLGSAGMAFVAICMLFFAFSTIIGWYFFGEQNVKAMFGHKAVKVYAAIVVICIVIGSALHVDLVWNLSDLFNGLMVFPNLIALLALSGLVAKAAHDKDIMK